jgi:hypothetical protein
MTERRLPPALEKKAWPSDPDDVTAPMVLWESDVLDWLYGKDGDPGLVERMEERALNAVIRDTSLEYDAALVAALRAELGVEEA